MTRWSGRVYCVVALTSVGGVEVLAQLEKVCVVAKDTSEKGSTSRVLLSVYLYLVLLLRARYHALSQR